jgi:hypothetical protein
MHYVLLCERRANRRASKWKPDYIEDLEGLTKAEVLKELASYQESDKEENEYNKDYVQRTRLGKVVVVATR